MFRIGPAPRPPAGAERGSPPPPLDHGDRANALVRERGPPPRRPRPTKKPHQRHRDRPPPRVTRGARERCGLLRVRVPLPEALDRQAAYRAWLAELDDIRHNVKMATRR